MTVHDIGTHFFPVPYHEFLDQALVWPTLDDNASWDTQSARASHLISDMPPQHAVGALHKLIRWAVNAPSGRLHTITEVGAREEAARTSALGRALAARSLLLDVDEVHAISQGDPADVNHLVAHVMVELAQRTPMEPEPMMELAIRIAARLTDRYVIVEKT